jgi:hypothetical protein
MTRDSRCCLDSHCLKWPEIITTVYQNPYQTCLIHSSARSSISATSRGSPPLEQDRKLGLGDDHRRNVDLLRRSARLERHIVSRYKLREHEHHLGDRKEAAWTSGGFDVSAPTNEGFHIRASEGEDLPSVLSMAKDVKLWCCFGHRICQ